MLRAMHDHALHHEAAAGRGAYRSAQVALQKITALRREIAGWIGGSESEISLHAGGTEALNTAILGLLRQGDHVVTTAAEHNSVLRPLQFLADQGTIEWTVVPTDSTGRVGEDAVIESVRPNTRLVACVHAANVNGVVQAIDAIGAALAQTAGEKKPLLLCDAAQTFGYLPLNVQRSGIDLLAAPGHKGGGGPLGTGFLYARQSTHDRLRPTVFGGTGTSSESLQMPTDYPEAFEAGNRNVPALVGWLCGLTERRGQDEPTRAVARIADQMRELAGHLYRCLGSISGVEVLGTPDEIALPVASFKVDSMSPAEVAMILDTEFGIEVRSGMHCAALAHRTIGSPPEGTVRVSCGESTSTTDIDELAAALREIVG